jgi:hypothetical protein
MLLSQLISGEAAWLLGPLIQRARKAGRRQNETKSFAKRLQQLMFSRAPLVGDREHFLADSAGAAGGERSGQEA